MWLSAYARDFSGAEKCRCLEKISLCSGIDPDYGAGDRRRSLNLHPSVRANCGTTSAIFSLGEPGETLLHWHCHGNASAMLALKALQLSWQQYEEAQLAWGRGDPLLSPAR